ncbi:MAG: 6-phosphogluconolactonase [Candidatus Krumholzibacteria bacterium]|nr:6-phosphogluconolactonase [Candidatus Krumholzibacteria bacterium]
MQRAVRVFDDLESMSLTVAAAVAELAADSTGPFSIALSGGDTPNRLYELLSDESTGIDWKNLHLFWGDERFVPHGDKSSNFGSAKRALLDRIDIPEENIHGIPVDAQAAADAAVIYEKELRDFFGIREDGFPRFDLVLLGLGDDGHTASIFPGDPVIDERKKWVSAVIAPAGVVPAERITLTLPVINSAKAVFFLISGESKADVLHDILFMGRMAEDQYPGARISPDGSLVWFVDRAAYGGDLDS